MSRYLVATAKDFGELIRGFRKQRGWTQARLAEHAGLLPKTISAIENGSGQVLLINVMRCLSTLEVGISLDSRAGIPTMPVPKPTIAKPMATWVETPIKKVKTQRSSASKTVPTSVSGRQVRKTSSARKANQTASAMKSLKEKW